MHSIAVEFSVAGITQMFFTHDFVQAFGESVGDGLEHDGVVGFEALQMIVDAEVSGDGDGTDVVFSTHFFGHEEIRHVLVGAARSGGGWFCWCSVVSTSVGLSSD